MSKRLSLNQDMGLMKKLANVISISRRRAIEGGVGVWRQLGEMVWLLLFRGIGPLYYHTAGFWQRHITWAEKKSHLNGIAYRKCVRRLNPVIYQKLSQNKIPEKAILQMFAIPTSKFLGRLDAAEGYDGEGNLLRTASELERLIRTHGEEHIVFKPLEGWEGRGVHIPAVRFTPEPRLVEESSGIEYSVAEYCTKFLDLDGTGDWLIEAYFRQHPMLAEINPSSVNTIRIWVVLEHDGSPRVLCAMLRVGRKGSVVDNTSAGGMVASIDIETGRLGALKDGTFNFQTHTHHPDSNVCIEGKIIPFWQEVCNLSCQALLVFPNLRFAGIDIAIGPDGPTAQELNVIPAHETAARVGYPTRELLRFL